MKKIENMSGNIPALALKSFIMEQRVYCLANTNGKGGSGGDHGGDVENPSEVGGDEGEIPIP